MFIGFVVLALGLLGMISLARGNPSLRAPYDDAKHVAGLADAGGFFGALAAYPLSRILSIYGAFIIDAGLAFLGLLIFTGTPFSSLRGKVSDLRGTQDLGGRSQRAYGDGPGPEAGQGALEAAEGRPGSSRPG